ncbi:MAG TPA: hypothetical protein EYQ25_00290 [Planctomycetes bacterium]|nr:hypothetical protein [Planctomycetota bacterium]
MAQPESPFEPWFPDDPADSEVNPEPSTAGDARSELADVVPPVSPPGGSWLLSDPEEGEAPGSDLGESSVECQSQAEPESWLFQNNLVSGSAAASEESSCGGEGPLEEQVDEQVPLQESVPVSESPPEETPVQAGHPQECSAEEAPFHPVLGEDSWLHTFDEENPAPAASAPNTAVSVMAGSWSCSEPSVASMPPGLIKQASAALLVGLLGMAAIRMFSGSGETQSNVGTDPLAPSHSIESGVRLQGPDLPMNTGDPGSRVLSPIRRERGVALAPSFRISQPNSQVPQRKPSQVQASLGGKSAPAKGPTEGGSPELEPSGPTRVPVSPSVSQARSRDKQLSAQKPVAPRQAAPKQPLPTPSFPIVSADRAVAIAILDQLERVLGRPTPVSSPPVAKAPGALIIQLEESPIQSAPLSLSAEDAVLAWFVLLGQDPTGAGVLWSPTPRVLCPDESPRQRLQRFGRWDPKSEPKGLMTLAEATEPAPEPKFTPEPIRASLPSDPGPMTHSMEFLTVIPSGPEGVGAVWARGATLADKYSSIPRASTPFAWAMLVPEQETPATDPGQNGDPLAQTPMGTLRRADKQGSWTGSEPSLAMLDNPKRVTTPRVGAVRILMVGGELFEGRLVALGQNRAWIETGLGTMSLDGERIDKIEKLDPIQVDSRGQKTRKHEYAGRPRVRVHAPGGLFVGHLISQEGDSVTLWTDEGFKITLHGARLADSIEDSRTTLRRMNGD